jgi:DNA (cytosine-5)-methyltransferase 1
MQNQVTIGSLFSGIGGIELGLEASLNARTIWQVEKDPFCRKILQERWPDAQRHENVQEVGKRNLPNPTIICGGFPCQDLSYAGKGAGLSGSRSGLWWEMHRIISELRPRVAVVENVPGLVTRGLAEVLGSLSEIGYDAEWESIRASDFGAPHKRERVFLVAYTEAFSDDGRKDRELSAQEVRGEGFNAKVGNSNQNGVARFTKSPEELGVDGFGEEAPNTSSEGLEGRRKPEGIQGAARQGLAEELRARHLLNGYGRWDICPIAPFCRVDDGVSYRVDRLRSLGNSVVPQCAEYIGRKIALSGLLNRPARRAKGEKDEWSIRRNGKH